MIRNPDLFYRYPPAGFDGEFCWEFLAPVWAGSTINGLMDFDAVLERWGQFLVFETKAAGVQPSKGQSITLTALAELPNFTVIFCAKEAAAIDGWIIWGPSRARASYCGTADDLVAYCRRWFLQAGHAPRRPPIPVVRAAWIFDIPEDVTP